MSFSASNTRKTSMPFSAAFSHEAVDHRVLVVPVAEQVLPAQQHLQAATSACSFWKVRSRSHGSSFRKRMQESKVAPPQHSSDQ